MHLEFNFIYVRIFMKCCYWNQFLSYLQRWSIVNRIHFQFLVHLNSEVFWSSCVFTTMVQYFEQFTSSSKFDCIKFQKNLQIYWFIQYQTYWFPKYSSIHRFTSIDSSNIELTTISITTVPFIFVPSFILCSIKMKIISERFLSLRNVTKFLNFLRLSSKLLTKNGLKCSLI